MKALPWLVVLVGTLGAAAAVTDRGLSGEIEYEDWLRRDAGLWRGTPRAVIEQLWRENPYLPGARETVAALQARDVHVAIISSGPLIHAEMVADELGIGPVFGNEILFESDGAGWVVSGRVRAHVALHGKGAALGRWQAQPNVAPDQCLAVGDAIGDNPLFERPGGGVAVNPGPP